MSYLSDASLVMIPSGVEAGTVFTSKPAGGSADLTFTRSNDTATRVGPNGYIEKVRTNLLLQSNTFNSSWSNTRSTESSGYAGYDGTNNAWKLEEDSNTGTHLLEQNVVSSAGVHTISCYFKAAERSGVQFLLEGSASYAFANFNLSTGEVYSSGQIGSFTLIEAKITSIGGGWYRCSVSASTNVATSWFKIYTLDAGFNTSYTGTTGEGIYIQDAQLEVGSVATDYIETTTAAVSVGPVADVPRINFDSVLPRTGSLLLEPQRTNLVIYSEYYGTYSFFQSALTSNNVVSPEGVQNGSTITITTQTTTQGMAGATITFDGTSNYTISGYYKKTATSVRAQLKLRYAFASGTTYSLVDFNLNTGAIASSLGENPNVVSFNSDWWYISVTTSTPPVGTGRIIVRADNQPVSTEISVFGLQCEAGAYPTSYIPTYSTAVTRGADAASKTGISSVIGQTEGTLYWEGKIIQLGDEGRISLSDGTANNRLWIRLQPSGSVSWIGRLNTTNNFEIVSLSNYSLGDTIKVAATYAANDFKFYINGVEQGTDTTYSTSGITLNKLDYGRYNGNDPMMQLTKQLIVFPTALTPAELATLTTI